MGSEEYTLSQQEANDLVLEHQGWCESIAKSVARSWNLDWKQDGLDGAAFEALIFCSRRFQPRLGVPFRGYARKRVHEAATEAARKSKGWRKTKGVNAKERFSRDVAVELYTVFPELRSGFLPYDESEDNQESGTRSAIQQLLISAAIFAARQGAADPELEDLVDYKKIAGFLAGLESVHQALMYYVYWEGLSLRGLSEEWGTDELNVIREHKILLQHLQKSLTKGKQAKSPRVRPGLKNIALKIRKKEGAGVFKKLIEGG